MHILSQASRKNTLTDPAGIQWLRNVREVTAIALFVVAAYLFIALFSFDQNDPAWSYSADVEWIANNAGWLGAWIADVLLYGFGYTGYLFPFLLLLSGWRFLITCRQQLQFNYLRHAIHLFGLTLALISASSLAWMFYSTGPALPKAGPGAGGALGDLVGRGFLQVSGDLGSSLSLLGLLLIGITLYTNLSWLQLMDNIGRLVLSIVPNLKRLQQFIKDQKQGKRARRYRELVMQEEKEAHADREPPKIVPTISKLATSDRVEQEKQTVLFESSASILPPLNLLDAPVEIVGQYSKQALEAMSRQVEMKLKDFNISVEVVAVHPGPVITRFELLPAPGLKVSQISNLAKDLARSLSVVSVRIVDVIPGTSVIGLEIPNEQRALVTLGEILSSSEYERSKSPLSLSLGKDISGQPVVADLAKMPHLLVAGTTGSGKSVALNAMILSLLYKATAAEVRLIMIDPKMLELSVYEGIQHLLAPVVTDMKEAANALRWAVAEMERRYKLMAALGVRNIAGYNRKVTAGIAAGEPLAMPFGDGEEALEALPLIVIIVDELADMMMTVGKKVEELIARLAQKARAAGIHLILATQRPSVDVITGLIKANIPTRIAFQVSSKIDSRTILDQMGAETLLGHGDMLYLPPGHGIPERVHGAFVSDEEVHKVVEELRCCGEPDYLDEILQEPSANSDLIPGLGNDDSDELYDQAVRIVTETRKASISYIQRRLKVGYNRAARMIEEMEATGVVSSLSSNGNREVLAPPPPEV